MLQDGPESLLPCQTVPRPRFARLAPERREAILDAAAAEFGEHGFSRASYNQIIDRAGLSKGAMYYYFADKQDLYATVVKEVTEQVFALLEPIGPFESSAEFWAEIEAFASSLYVRVLSLPRLVQLMPALLNPRPSAEDAEVLSEMYEHFGAFLQDLLGRGRKVGAVRSDLPDDLLLAAMLAVGEAVDRWIAKGWAQQQAEGSSPTPPDSAMLHKLIGLLRRVAEPGPPEPDPA